MPSKRLKMIRQLLSITLSAVVLALASPLFAAGEPDSCSASFDGSELVIRNTHIERHWRIANGLLVATSLRDLDAGREWLAAPSAQSRPQAPDSRKLVFSKHWATSHPVERPSLVVELMTAEAPPSGYRFRIFPEAAAISVQTVDAAQAATSGALDRLDLASQHLMLTQVELFDQTDTHNELVNERKWLLHPSQKLSLQGNLFTLQDPAAENGLIFLKEAPLPHARPGISVEDFAYEGALEGAHSRIVLPATGGYPVTTLVYSGGRPGITQALQQYQRQIRPYIAGRDGMFVSNTWGDRSRDARINSSFMQQEIEAGARLGIDVIQIDDGWQQGRSKNSARAGGVWNGFWNANPGFWNVNRERFPQGLAPIVASAREKNIGFGLWFAPDSSDDFANWERDAARLLELHRTLGIDYFKIDGVKATSRLSETRLKSLFDRVLKKSEGKVVFDLDVTAEIRPGYFGAMNVGPLFVENRYTDRHSYWPHQTLRNFWQLSQYIDPMRLRIEFLNNARNANLYPDDPLAPSRYSPACLFATTMMANPLGWFEVSGLPPRYFEQLTPLIRTWKQERVNMQSGRIFPIGNAPDGVVWSGFVSISPGSKNSYLLVFRERNSSGDWSAQIPRLPGEKYGLELLAGQGSASYSNGKIEVRIPQQLGFAWFRMQPR